MGINNLAVQTFSSSGSQSVCRANKADSSRQIKSDFISRPSVSYINGSGMSVINGTLTALPYSVNNNSETFRIPNNIDAISDIVLSMDLNITKKSNTTFKCGGIYYSKTFLLDLIDNIEIKMGGLVIQTIYPGDIYMRNYSELGHLLSQENSFNKIKDSDYLDTGSIIGHTTTSNEETISFSVSLPFIGRSSDKDRSFLQTGSFTKNLVVTVNYHLCISGPTGSDLPKAWLDIVPLLKMRGDADGDASVSISTKLCILSHIITDTEKNFIKQNIINRVINTSVGTKFTRIQETYIKKATGVTSIEIDLDSVDLNVTHLLFCLNVAIFYQEDKSSTLPKQFLKGRGNAATDITPTNLKSEYEYVSGDNKLSSSWGKAGVDSNISATEVINPDVLGVFEGWLNSAELILGNETTGKIPCSALTSNQTEFKLMNVEENFYILKLADNAFSTAGVPFSRIKNKKLLLEVRNKFFNIEAVTTPTAATSSNQGADTVIGTYADDKKRDATISVCACGTTLQIINNNTISFSYI